MNRQTTTAVGMVYWYSGWWLLIIVCVCMCDNGRRTATSNGERERETRECVLSLAPWLSLLWLIYAYIFSLICNALHTYICAYNVYSCIYIYMCIRSRRLNVLCCYECACAGVTATTPSSLYSPIHTHIHTVICTQNNIVMSGWYNDDNMAALSPMFVI